MADPELGSEGRAWVARGFMAMAGLFALLKARVGANSAQAKRLWEEIDDLKERQNESEEHIAFDTTRTVGLDRLCREIIGVLKEVCEEANEILIDAGKTPRYTAKHWDYYKRFGEIEKESHQAVEKVRRERAERERRRQDRKTASQEQ